MREESYVSGFLPGDGIGEWSNVAWWQKLHRELRTPRKVDMEAECGPMISVAEAMKRLGRSRSFVDRAIREGRLNSWQDPRNRRRWVLVEDVEWLASADSPEGQQKLHGGRSDLLLNGIANCKMQNAKCKMGTGLEVECEEAEDEEELAPYGQGAAAMLEWMDRRDRRREEVAREVASTPTVEPVRAAGDNPKSEIRNPQSVDIFPIGWVGWRDAANVLSVCKDYFNRMAVEGKFQRRMLDGRRPWLYDSVEIERVAEERLSRSKPIPGKRLDWWGSRAKKIELAETDGWISSQDAADMLGVTANRVGRMCDAGQLPCYQREPGKRGSKLWVSYHHVLMVAERVDRQLRRAKWEESRNRSAEHVEMEDWRIDPVDPRGESAATRRDHGEHYTTKQAALLLGVSVSAVHNLRERGRLAGVHLRPKKVGSAKEPWWFFRKEDVHSLQADGEYLRRAARGKRAQRARSDHA